MQPSSRHTRTLTNWPQPVMHNAPGDVSGAPVMYGPSQTPDEIGAGYGYQDAEAKPETDIFYYHSDHLGSTSYMTDNEGNATQFVCYMPYGETLVDEHTTAPDPAYLTAYKFNGKEMDAETGLYYYGARYYEPEMAMWYGVDALAEKYASMGGYVYCAGNPIQIKDPDGNEIDWVQDQETKQYVWMDNVTSMDNVPDGYRYIGKDGNSILNDLNINTFYEPGHDTEFTMTADHDKMGSAAYRCINNIDVSFSATARVIYSPEAKNSNNIMGICFDGVDFEGKVVQSISAGSSNGVHLFESKLTIETNKRSFSKDMTAPDNDYIRASNQSIQTACMFFSANDLSSMKREAIIKSRIGLFTLEKNFFLTYKKPIDITWTIIRNSVIW